VFGSELPAPFGRYRLLKLLGQGGMGAVYLAHDTALDRPVALKVPHFDADDGPEVLARFYREARSAATVVHPNICPVHDVGEIGGVSYLTMAYVEGKPLSHLIEGPKPPTPRQSALLVRKLALALEEAHRRGVIHRDLKPANVMIDRRGEPVIMDFGLARRGRKGDPRLTQEGSFLGTPAYSPPEQVSGKVEAMGPASDVYSLGVILYELLAGRLPFTGDMMAILSSVLLEQPPPPSQFRPDLDVELETICLKAMAKKIPDRHASMADLAAELQNYLRGATVPSAPLKPQPPAPPAKPAPKDRGIHVSDLGGRRSMAQAYQQEPARPRAEKAGARRRRQ
jgi:serine/threonine protein kinase